MKTPQKAISETLGRLRERYPAKGALDLGSTFQFLVAVVLSARTRDEQVLKALPELYRNFPTPRKLADADEPEIAKTIKTIGFYRAKAKFIKKLAQEICDRFDGEVPETMEGLTGLDPAKAISDFTQQQFTLEAAQKSFKALSGLSLFNFI